MYICKKSVTMERKKEGLYIALRERAGIAFTVKDRKYAKTNSSLSKRACHTFTPLQKTVHGVYIGCISPEKKVICLIHSTTNCIK